MVNQIQAVVKSLRPAHWIKNLLLFAALVFSGNLFAGGLFITTLWAVIIFSLAASSMYLFNDVVDRESDRAHPVKRWRPIARGLLSTPNALFVSSLLGVTAIYLSSFLSFFFLVSVVAYILLQIAYTLFLKTVPVVDIFAIAAGFVLRVWAGAFVIDVHLSVWFLLCIISASLFLAAGKRRAEIFILAQFKRVRKTSYQLTALESFISMFGNTTWFSWALFTFFEPSPRVGILPFSSDLPLTLAGIGKWLMLTIPFVIFGVMRYLHIIYTTMLAETPERTLIQDRQLLAAFLVWGGLVILILYS